LIECEEVDHTGAMTFIVRHARLSDMTELQSVFSRASMSNENDRPLLLKHPEWLVLSDDAVRERRTRVAIDESDAAVIGFASYAITDGSAELTDLFVDPSRTRRGIGKALVLDMCEQLRDKEFETLQVTANAHAMAFYEQMGFEADQLIDVDGHSELRMRKSIRQG
jgi:ribosomal protein S18 acetylase RimI-like enzyme